ncbi:hypothetical protein BH09SUM1_BH09SUM1_14670 [soil metagenome]
MKDGPIRTGIKFASRMVFNVNLAGTRAIFKLRGDKPYQLGGDCQKCAACCETPGIQVGKILWYMPSARALFLWWQRRVNGFELQDREIGHRVFIFRCTHFDREARRCDSYHSRPGMCRDYPRGLLYTANPEMLPGCGYKPVACGAEKFIAALQQEGLSPDQLEKLKEKLRLEE